MTELIKTPYFSIVMPAYNAEAFIDQSVDAVMEQTFEDWELIVVDDGSSDDTSKMVEHYQRDDDRIFVIRLDENKGAAEARNVGMREATGKYIWFPDSDDSFEPTLLERVYEETELAHPEIVMFGLVERYYGNAHNFLYYNEIPMKKMRSYDRDEWHPMIIDFERNTNFGYSNSKVYNLDFLRKHNVEFEDILLGEDFVFNIKAFRDASSISVIAGTPYIYRKVVGQGTTNSNEYSPELYYDLHKMRIEMMRELLIEWGVYDEYAQEVLGGLYARYVLSAIERTFHDNHKYDAASRKKFVDEIIHSDLFQELIPYAKASQSRQLATAIGILKSENPKKIINFCRLIGFVRKYFYKYYARAKTGR